MNYYVIVEATNALIAQHSWLLQRCRRRCDGPARYVVFDGSGSPVLSDKAYKNKRLGLTLQELLMQLCEQHDGQMAASAKDLLSRLNILIANE